MTPIDFPESNARCGPPAGMSESQVSTIKAWHGKIEQGSLDGETLTVVCWQPDAGERQMLAQGYPIFLSFVGGLPPHYPTMSFALASSPA